MADVERRVERFQCILPYPSPDDPIVQVYLQRLVDGEQLGSLVEIQLKLSDFSNPRDILNVNLVEELERLRHRVPASDRTVSVNHNSAEYHQANAALDHLEKVLKETNEPIEPEEREQRVAEVSALRRLLQSTKVRIQAVAVIASTTLVGLAAKFGDKILGAAASTAWEAVKALFKPFL
jgi:hypothetical protein